jgi:twitching motility protein PilT
MTVPATPRISELFDALLDEQGRDLHLSIGYPPLGRIRGELTPLREELLTAPEVEALLSEIVPAEQKRQLTEAQNLDFSYTYGTKARFRANCFQKMTGLAAVLRALPSQVPSLEELRLPEGVQRLAERRSGLVLVTGPQGSGRSTTLAAMVHHINQTRAAHILTIEDPVEFVHEPAKSQVTHREVGLHASSFAAALRSAAREDPNVLLVGELSTPETMKLALQHASSGVLVLAAMYTPGAAITFERIIHAFPADEQPQIRGLLAESLAGFISQRLVRTADGTRRVAAVEVLIGSSGISALIRERKVAELNSRMQGGQALGMQTLDMHLEKLVAAGTVTPEDALAKAQNRETFAVTLQRIRPGFEPPEDAKT